MPDGWYVYDIWESPAQFQRFGVTCLGRDGIVVDVVRDDAEPECCPATQ